MAATVKQVGDFLQADFFQNLEGLNITDSPFAVKSSQAVAGYNYDYYATGGISKRQGHTLLNTDGTNLQSLNFSLYNTASGSKTRLRAAGTHIQTMDSMGVVSNLSSDTAISVSAFFTATTPPIVSSQFNTASLSTTWFAGGNQGNGVINGYTGTNITANGAATFAGSLSVSDSGGSGSALSTGTYFYSVVAFKASTSVTSNAALDTPVSMTAGHTATVQMSGITAYDTTKYSQIWIYRSIVGGVTGFTAGDLVAKIAFNGSVYSVVSGGGTISGTTYIDTGSFLSTSTAVPRAGSTSLDNSTLQSISGIGQIKTIGSFAQRLVVSSGNTLYFSDVNKPESWPIFNTITIPSGGEITAQAIASFNTSVSNLPNYYLSVFKEKELWVVSGQNFINLFDSNGNQTQAADIALAFIDHVGCPAQPLCVFANGFLFWIDYRGVYLWDGSYKPVYISRPIEYDFGINGDIDLANLSLGCGAFYRKQNQVIWFLSSVTLGLQKLALKLDLRLSLPNLANALAGRVMDAVFMKDSLSYNVYASTAMYPTYNEKLYAGGNDGNIWEMFGNPDSDNNQPIAFSYQTRPEDLGQIGVSKRFNKVILWVKNSTTATITLNYWVGYKLTPQQQASYSQPIASTTTQALWDQAFWDSVSWDSVLATYTPVVFNLVNPTVSTEGDAITLQFVQSANSTPLIIGGYSILYSPLGMRK